MTLQQLAFDLPHRTAQGAEDFLVSDCNRAAVELIDAWPHWQENVQLLIGPPSSGKTHLARVWQGCSGAVELNAQSLGLHALDGVSEGSAFLVEDVDRGAYEENALFHLLNLAREKRLFVLLSARLPAPAWKYRLADLVSRIKVLPLVAIGAPDDTLLKAVMLKHFADRQLDIDPRVLDFIALRIDRSLQAAADAVARIDRAGLGTGRKISRQLAAQVLQLPQVLHLPNLPEDA